MFFALAAASIVKARSRSRNFRYSSDTPDGGRHDRSAADTGSRIFALNLTYAVGVIAVFLGLATLATFAQIGLGELFHFDGFKQVEAGLARLDMLSDAFEVRSW